MKIGLWADNVNFPSLPLMKLSAYHKSRGDAVTLIDNSDSKDNKKGNNGNNSAKQAHYDIAYISKTFNLPNLRRIPALDFTPNADKVVCGGTGPAITVENEKEVYDHQKDPPLASAIEHISPDYGLYPDLTKDTAFGFLTRGCPNECKFCVVSNKEGCRSIQTAELNEFWRGQKHIKLMDANLLACREREKLIQELITSNAVIDYTQGLDARCIDADTAILLCRTNIKMVHFAFDLLANEQALVRGLTIFRKHFPKNDRSCKVYILTNYNTSHAEDWYRVQKVIELGYQPDVRIYRKGTHDRFLTDLQRWANASTLYRSCAFADYVPRADGQRCGALYQDILQYREG